MQAALQQRVALPQGSTTRPRTLRRARVVAYVAEPSAQHSAPPPPEPKAANQLEALRQMSKVVADTGEIWAMKEYKPIDATTNPSLVLKAMQDPEYCRFLDDAIYQERRRGFPQGIRPNALVADQLAVNIGTELLKIVPGRVSTEVDAHLSYDAQATYDKALHLVDLYVQRGVDPKRLYIKIASTWEGIRACEMLQDEGIDCNMTLLFSFAQACACGDAGAALISPFVGRILDWHKKAHNRDYTPEEDPGVASVKRIYKYYKQYNYHTVVMAASFRNAGEIRQLAGCDNITIAPPLLKELEASTDPLPYQLWPRMGGCEDEHQRMDYMARDKFYAAHNEDQMAVDKLQEGIDNFSADQRKLEDMIGAAMEKAEVKHDMTTLVEQIQQLLALPATEVQLRRHAKLTEGLGLEVRPDAGGGKGRGVFATKSFKTGQLLFKEPPLAAIQHSDNRAVAWVCGHCFRFLGSVEQQMGRQIDASRQAGLAERQAAEDDSDEGSGGSAGSSAQHEAALALDADAVAALAAGTLRLPHKNAVPLPQPVPCPGGCSEESYCSAACAEAAWQQYHKLLCVGQGAAGSSSASSKGKAAVASSSGSRSAERRRAALQEFLHLADETNDVFRLAAVVLARTLLAAEQLLEQQGGAGASGAEGNSSGSSGGEPSADACWRALLAAWEPFGCGHKGLWWEAIAAPPDAAADMRQLAADSLELLTAALPSRLARRYPALLSLEVWGSVIGMFELNNLAVYVGSPITRWLQALERLPDGERAAAYDAAGPYLEALPDELPGCEGNAFYALHSCCNHSCAPSGEAFKRDEDDDGSAVILALRDIAAGEEITLSYIDEEAPLAERREQLADYGFACACDKCAAEELAAELGAL